jgi:hypothetical protein
MRANDALRQGSLDFPLPPHVSQGIGWCLILDYPIRGGVSREKIDNGNYFYSV